MTWNDKLNTERMTMKRKLLLASAASCLLFSSACFKGAGMPAGGPFIGRAKVIEGEIPPTWYHLGLPSGDLRSPHGGDKVFLESVTMDLFRKDASDRPDVAVYVSIKPNFSSGSPNSSSKEDRAGWIHARLKAGIEALGGEYEQIVPMPPQAKEDGKSMLARIKVLRLEREIANKQWAREAFAVNRFERVLRVEARVGVPLSFLCWPSGGSFRIVVLSTKDARRFYEIYIVVPEEGSKMTVPAGLELLNKLTFHKPKF